MIKKLLLYVVSALAFLPFTTGCEQANIYTEVDFNVTLDPSNTYYAGEPVKFNISGNPDNLLFYSGEIGSNYEYKDRYDVPAEEVNSIVLDMQIQHRYGSPDDGALDIYYTDQFNGLSGDGAKDREDIQAMLDGGMQGWTKVEFEDNGRQTNVSFPVSTPNMAECAENLCIAFHWRPSAYLDNPTGIPMDTYFVNGVVTVNIEGVNPVQHNLKTLMGTALMMDESIDPYLISSGNGSIRLDTDNDISFAGGYVDQIKHSCEGWIFSYPRAFNVTSPDQGVVIKNLQNYMHSYEYTFNEAGTYTVTFVGTNANYAGSSREVRQMTVNILNTPLVTE